MTLLLKRVDVPFLIRCVAGVIRGGKKVAAGSVRGRVRGSSLQIVVEILSPGPGRQGFWGRLVH